MALRLAGRREGRGGGPEPVNGEGTVHMAAHGRGQAVKAQVHIAMHARLLLLRCLD